MLFDYVPDAKMPDRAEPPTNVQDLLEDYRMSKQRAFSMQAQLIAEEKHLTGVLKKIKSSLLVGETVAYAGVTAFINDHGGLTIKCEP